MKKLLFILALLSLLVFLAAGSVHAQTKIRADIPFAFMAMNKPLPEGSYTAAGYAPPALVIRELTNPKVQAYVLTVGVETNRAKEVKPMLVFRRYGDHYFLGQVWMGASTTGRELLKSARELQVAKNNAEPELIYVAAK